MLCRAPHLFAAVLQQAGAGREVLPLLSDPARAAFQGLSITARHNRAFHTYPFLQVPFYCNLLRCKAWLFFFLGSSHCMPSSAVSCCVTHVGSMPLPCTLVGAHCPRPCSLSWCCHPIIASPVEWKSLLVCVYLGTLCKSTGAQSRVEVFWAHMTHRTTPHTT